ncbi:MAG: prepilin-type N-terminal cleavage/methylation domain-containing protein [Lachnospiraceae bacterium]
MDKQKKGKVNNRGFSLIEVLVAIAILAVITLPIIKAFTTSGVINKKAREVENANTAASAVVEDFKSLSVRQLKEKYKYKYDDATGVYEFTVTDEEESFYRGVNGEEYAINVTLDPSAYEDSIGQNGEHGNNPSNNINSYDMPSFASLSTQKDYIIRDEIYKWDNDAKGTLGIRIHDFDEKKMKRSVIVNVELSRKENSYNDNTVTYIQKVNGKVVYRYSGTYDLEYDFSLEDTELVFNREGDLFYVSGENGVKNVYLFYIPYDAEASELVAGQDNTYYADDNIVINYNYDNTAGTEYSDLNVYIIPQSVRTEDNRSIIVNRENIEININGLNIDLGAYGTVDLSSGAGIEGPVNIYSNIYGWSEYKAEGNNKSNGLTVNGSPGGEKYLYEIRVDIWSDGDSKEAGEEPVVTVVSTKEN